MRAEARLDVRDRYVRGAASACPAKRTRRVPLDDEQVGRRIDQGGDRSRDLARVRSRVRLARTIETRRAILAEGIGMGVERRVLARQDQARAKAARGQGMGDGGKLDRFGPSADDQP